MTQYMLAVHHSPSPPVPAPEDMQKVFAQVDKFNAELQASGQWVFGGGLESPEIATVVDARGNEPIYTDGPFGETKEHLGGFGSSKPPTSTPRSRWPPRRRPPVKARWKFVRSRPSNAECPRSTHQNSN